jgi:arylsulfatase
MSVQGRHFGRTISAQGGSDYRKRTRRAGTLCLVCGLLLLAGCEREPRTPPRRSVAAGEIRPNIVFIVIDALRADRLGAYGYPGGNSPTLDAIADGGVTFERAIAQAPWTQPSVASLFCSRYPSVHRVLDYDAALNAAYGDAPKVAVLDGALRTLAQVLRDHGYITAGFVANPFLLREFGFAQGFDHFDTSFAENTTPGTVINEAALRWLRERDSKRPFFLYLHYMDVHGPYDARPEIIDPLLDAVEKMPNKRELSPEELRGLGYLRKLPSAVSRRERHLPLMRYREYWVARYDAGVREMDNRLRALREGLEELGLWEDAFVVVTSDHGESLLEHGQWDHGHSVHDTELHVPLLLRWRGVLPAGKRIQATARLIDLMPSLLEQLQLPIPSGLQGVPLGPLLAGSPAAQSLFAFAEGVKSDPEQCALYLGDWKLAFTGAAGGYQLYDLKSDPLEQRDLSDVRPAEVARMRQLLERQVRRNRQLAGVTAAEHAPLTDEQAEQLRSLGYLQ